VVVDELDGVVIAPGNHRVLFENEDVRVLDITIAVGETTPLHSHLAPTVLYRLSGSHFIRRDEQGNTMFDSRADPAYVMPLVSFNATLPRHAIVNTGHDDLHLIGVELKHPDRS
jgi:mannose-6-phosphate isomerase-like protein (cupin superfamily)